MHRHEWIRDKLTYKDTILEAGCAENPVFRNTPFKVTTMDKAPHPDYKPDVIGEAENLPFGERVFEVVVEGELLEHVPDPQKVLREAIRVAKKKVVLTVPWEHQWPPDLKPFWNPGHVRFYTPDTFKGELAKTDLPFKIEEIRNGPWTWLGAEVFCDKEKTMTEEAPKVIISTWLDSQVKLNLGSFRDTIGNGWTNIDILAVQQYIPKDHKFKQHDLRQGIPYGNGSVDLIRTSHLIEHLTLEEAHRLCSEMFRVLKVGGIARISTPDARIIMRHYMAKDMGFFNIIQPPEFIQAPTEGEKLSRLLFSGDYQHRALYDFDILKSFLAQASFQKVQQVSPGFSFSETMKNETQDQHEIISLVVEAVR